MLSRLAIKRVNPPSSDCNKMSRAVFLLLLVAALDSTQSAVLHRRGPALQTSDFYTYEGILEYLDGLAHTYRHRVTLHNWGTTYENRSLRTITITNGDGRKDKNVIFIDAAIHAREWLTPTAALYIIDQLVVGFENNTELLKDYDWVVLPLVNPDGYTYSRSIDAVWRKNRSPSGRGCFGTDLNRNFAVGWGGNSTSNDPCHYTIYCGREPFSEAESRAVRKIMHHLMETKRGIMYITIHAAASKILLPWGYEKIRAKNFKELAEVAQAGADAIANAPIDSPSQYKVTPSHEWYTVGGSSKDYAYSIGFPLAFTLELPEKRNNYRFDFFPPTKFIRELVEETWIGIRAIGQKAIEKYPISKRNLFHRKLRKNIR